MAFGGFFVYNNADFTIPQGIYNQNISVYRKGYIFVDKKMLLEDYKPLLIFNSTEPGFPYINIIKKSDQAADKEFIAQISDSNHFNFLIKNRENPISAAILYNEFHNELKIARNSFGLTSLFYIHIPDQFFAFSSDLRSLLKMDQVAHHLAPNSKAIWNYLSISHESKPYSSETFYRDIKSIIPGQINTFSCKEVNSDVYMEYNPNRWKHLSSVEEYGEEFQYLLKRSVERSIHKKLVIGAHLSGGLDSSSICAMVRELRPNLELNVFYSETNSKLNDEKHHSIEVARKLSASHYTINPTNNDIDTLILYTSLYGRPEQMALSPSFQSCLIESSIAKKCDILLTGHDGDGIVGKGSGYLNQLLAEENWEVLRLQLSNIAKNSKLYLRDKNWDKLSLPEKEQLVFINFLSKHIISSLKSFDFINISRLFKIANRTFKLSPVKLVEFGGQSLLDKVRKQVQLYPINIQTTSLDELYNSMPSNYPININSSYANDILFTQTVRITEEFSALSEYYGYDIQHPFYDANLYELCLAVPEKIKFGEGLGRAHLRQAMIGMLPESVRTRGDKAIFNDYSQRAAMRLYGQSRDFLTDSSPVWDYVDKGKFIKVISLIQNNHPSSKHLLTFFLNRTIFLAVWLVSNKY